MVLCGVQSSVFGVQCSVCSVVWTINNTNMTFIDCLAGKYKLQMSGPGRGLKPPIRSDRIGSDRIGFGGKSECECGLEAGSMVSHSRTLAECTRRTHNSLSPQQFIYRGPRFQAAGCPVTGSRFQIPGYKPGAGDQPRRDELGLPGWDSPALCVPFPGREYILR